MPDETPSDMLNPQLTEALLAAQESYRDTVAMLDGWVRQLTDNGWSEDQARCIVASTFGWRAAS